MTRREITGKRDLSFSSWIRDKLPDSSTGFLVSDIDFVLFNYKTKKVAIVEVKTRNADLKRWQKEFYRNLHNWIKNGVSDGWVYKGIYVIQFENTCFDDGICYLNYKPVSEQKIIEELSL